MHRRRTSVGDRPSFPLDRACQFSVQPVVTTEGRSATFDSVARIDPLAIVEAAYALDTSEHDWLQGLANSVVGLIAPVTCGTFARVYDVSDPANPRFGPPCWATNDPPRAVGLNADLAAYYGRYPGRVLATYASVDEGLGLDLSCGEPETLRKILHGWDTAGMYGNNGRNPSGRGCILGVYLPMTYRRPTPANRLVLARVARHIAAGYRLRERPATQEAVLLPNGDPVDLQGEATSSSAREMLRRSAAAVSRARQQRHADPHRAAATWEVLVDARWSLVDYFESRGEHFLVARRNDPATAPLALLSQRERQVAALVAMGHANKVIGYELGIATSTVGVLVGRALARLGLHSRKELGAAYLAQTGNPRPEP